jgi:hypothetical protein
MGSTLIYTTAGVEISADRSCTWVALAGWAGDVAVVELLDPLEGTETAEEITALTKGFAAVVLDPRSNAATLISGLRGVQLKEATGSDLAVAWGRLIDWLRSGRLKYHGHPDLSDAVRTALARRTSSGAELLDRRRSDPAPVVAVELAVFALADGASYDVLQSAW